METVTKQGESLSISTDMARVYDVIGLHHHQPISILLECLKNTKRFSDYLHAVERQFLMAPGEPSGEPEDAGAPIDDECLVRKFPARSIEHYVDQFGAALAVKYLPRESVAMALADLIPTRVSKDRGEDIGPVRRAFEAWHCERYKTNHQNGMPTRDIHNGFYAEDYAPERQQELWEACQATVGPVVAPLLAEIERLNKRNTDLEAVTDHRDELKVQRDRWVRMHGIEQSKLTKAQELLALVSKSCHPDHGKLIANLLDHQPAPPAASEELSPDANVETVRQMLLQRSAVGLKKYGITTDRSDVDMAGWLTHLQEELLDGAVYIARLQSDLKSAPAAKGEGDE